MKYYICGNSELLIEKCERYLTLLNETPINPNKINIPLEETDLLSVRLKLIDLCDCIYLSTDWKTNKRCKQELNYAKMLNKKIKYGNMQWKIIKREKIEQ